MPPLAGDGWMIVGDSAGFLNSQRLKGIHLAIRAACSPLKPPLKPWSHNNFSAAKLKEYKEAVDASWINDELWEVRNFHQGFENGLLSGLLHTACSSSPAAAACMKFIRAHAATRHGASDQLPADGGKHAHLIGKAKGDRQAHL